MNKKQTTEVVQPTFEAVETVQSVWCYLTINQFIKKHPAFTTGGLRALIFNENTNGLSKSGAIVRIGRKILIDETRFFAWVESQNKAVA